MPTQPDSVVEHALASAGKYSIRAVDRVCDILDAIQAQSGNASLPAIALTTRMPKSTAFRYLSVLEERGYIERNSETSTYRLGLSFQPRDLLSLERLKRFALPILTQLRDELSETTNLGILENGHVVHVLVIESPQQMRLAARVGERALIHSTALGKAMATQLDTETVRAILALQGMPTYTPMTITSQPEYLTQLAQAQTDGFAMDDSENQIGGRCIAVPIPDTPVRAGISVSAPASQLPIERVPSIVRQLQTSADHLARQMQDAL